MERMSILTIANKITNEDEAYRYLEELRWGKDRPGQACPHCGSMDKFYFLQPKTGSRRTGTAVRESKSARRVWKCAGCRKQFSVTTGTIFHGSHISLRVWLMVVFEMCSNKNGLAAREVERKYDLTPKSAWFMLHRVREAMKKEPLVGMLSGTILADETYIGGLPKNKHQQGRKRPGGGKGIAGQPHHKIAVLSLLDKGTGEVRSRVMPNVTAPDLAKAIAEQVDIGQSTLHTDGTTCTGCSDVTSSSTSGSTTTSTSTCAAT